MDISGIMGFAFMIGMTVLLYRTKVHPEVLFVTLPVAAGFLSGFSIAEIGSYILKGIEIVIPTAFMFGFSILFFGMLNEAGLFDVLAVKILKRVRKTKRNIFVITVVISVIAHLSGSGAVSYLVVITTCKKIYEENKIPLAKLMCLSSLTFGVMNMLPWAGPCGRLASVLGVDAASIWRLCIPSQIFGILMVFLIALVMARSEKSISAVPSNKDCMKCKDLLVPQMAAEKNRKSFYLSAGSMAMVIILLAITKISSWIIFMAGFLVLCGVNFKNIKKKEMKKYLKSARTMAVTVLASGVMVGIMTQSRMLVNMTEMILGLLPVSMKEHMHILFGVLSNPLSWIVSGEVEIFGLLPIVANIVSESQITAEITAAAFLISYSAVIFVLPMTVSVYVGLSLCGIRIREHIRQTYMGTLFLSVTMLGFAILSGVIPF